MNFSGAVAAAVFLTATAPITTTPANRQRTAPNCKFLFISYSFLSNCWRDIRRWVKKSSFEAKNLYEQRLRYIAAIPGGRSLRALMEWVAPGLGSKRKGRGAYCLMPDVIRAGVRSRSPQAGEA